MSALRTTFFETVLAALPVALVYFSGWAYLTSYLGRFGIDATQVNISFTTVLVYAFIPLKSFCMVAFIFISSVVLYIQMNIERLKINNYDWLVRIFPIVTFLIILMAPFLIKAKAGDFAKEMADKVWVGDKSQSVVVLDNSQNEDNAVKLYRSCVAKWRIRQIIGLQDQMYVLCRSLDTPCDKGTVFLVGYNGKIIYSANNVREGFLNEKICK